MAKGDELEDQFYGYLVDQQSRGELVNDAHQPELCKIYKKRGYYSPERECDVIFDVVIEIYRRGGKKPHLYVVFECKNYGGSLPVDDVSYFSDQLRTVFGHAAKGVIVTSSRLQSSAQKTAEKRGLGIVKYDDSGFEVIAERSGRLLLENRYLQAQFFDGSRPAKPLKFSALNDGAFLGSINRLLGSIDPSLALMESNRLGDERGKVPYISVEGIRLLTEEIRKRIEYVTGPVSVSKICKELSIELEHSDRPALGAWDSAILGYANFDRKKITIHPHDNLERERFTVAHEIGHFCLQHDRYLRSESIIESDLFVVAETAKSFMYERLEFQANKFASELLLPELTFRQKTEEYRKLLELGHNLKSKGSGFIFVDDQPCNFEPYLRLLKNLSDYFGVSKQAIEIKLNELGILTDERRAKRGLAVPPSVGEVLGAVGSKGIR